MKFPPNIKIPDSIKRVLKRESTPDPLHEPKRPIRRNPKDNPFTVTVSALFTHFQRIFLLNYKRWQAKYKNIPLPTDAEMSALLKLPNPYFLNEYKTAANNFPNKKVFVIFGILREYDMKSKGIGGGSAGDGELLREMLMKIFMI